MSVGLSSWSSINKANTAWPYLQVASTGGQYLFGTDICNESNMNDNDGFWTIYWQVGIIIIRRSRDSKEEKIQPFWGTKGLPKVQKAMEQRNHNTWKILNI